MKIIRQFLNEYGLKEPTGENLTTVLSGMVLIIISIIVYWIVNKYVLKILSHYINKNKIKWDNYLLERKVLQKISGMTPGIIFYTFADTLGTYKGFIQKLSTIYILFISTAVISSFLNAIDDYYRTFSISKVRPIKGLLQVLKVSVYILTGIIVIAIIVEKSPLLLLSGIGALTAIFTLVFKDSLLGFVAGVQLSTNDMLRIGDWIEMPKYGADGDVIDISLNTVKVQNWDKTIVTIPAYALISDSFKNWRGMENSGGRRVKRAINIDTSSIKFCTAEMIEKYKKIQYLKEYIEEKQKEIDRYNKENNVISDSLVNGRHLTNIGTFRAYITGYLKNNPKIHKGLTYMVRQLPPTETGLPLEIYAFVNDVRWVYYESIVADIFDHILAVVTEFDLRVFQNPAGYDLSNFKNN